MSAPMQFDITPFLGQDEGQHFDRKSLFAGSAGNKRSRQRREVRDQVARYVAAFANAEGGVLVLGLEDDGTPTGHSLPEAALKQLLDTPRRRLSPPQAAGFVVAHEGVELVVFEVQASDVPVRVHGNGFPLRMGDQTVEVSESQVRSLKFHGMAESWESRPSPYGIDSLDTQVLARARQGGGLVAMSDRDYLLRRKLSDRQGAGVVLRRAAELVFAEHGPDHANAGVRIFRVVGTERRTGPEHNVEEIPRIEGNLPDIIEQAVSVLSRLVRRPSRLVGTRFRPAPEYPDFAWKEALLNAIAHRDYSTEGRGVEVWLYDDRMEVVSPGGLMPEVALEALRAGERIHSSRNPRTVRALVDLGFMRDQGEGIPRMFAEMEGSFLPAPELVSDSTGFRVILRNTPTLTAEDREFVSRIEGEDLTPQEFRALLEARRTGRLDNARLRRILGLDTHQSSVLIRKLRDHGWLRMHRAGSASYYTLTERLGGSDRGDLDADRGDLDTDRGDLDADRGDLDADRGESSGDDVSPALRNVIVKLGVRPRKDKLRHVIHALVSTRPRSAEEIALILGRGNVRNLVERHLTPMVADGILQRTERETHHPDQAYVARRPYSAGPLFDRDDALEET